MSQVNLNTVIFYKGDAEHKPVAKELPLAGIDHFFPPLTFPARGMTFLYGHRNPAIPYLLNLAGLGEQDAAIVDVHVEIGNWLRQKVDFSDSPDSGLQGTEFLSVLRAKKEIVDDLSAAWVGLCKAKGLPVEDWPRKPTALPHLLDVVMSGERYNHLSVIAYTVDTPQIGPFQVATVFNLDAITLYDGGSLLQDVDLVL